MNFLFYFFRNSELTILSLAILGSAFFRNSVLGVAWLVLTASIFIYTVADVWYYYLEVIDSYWGDDFVNTLWVIGLAYGLHKDEKTI